MYLKEDNVKELTTTSGKAFQGSTTREKMKEGRWLRGRADVSEPGGPGFDSSSHQPQFVAHQH